MQIIQLTDQHVGQPGEAPNGVDVREHFLQLCQTVASIAPDYVVVTGDLCALSGEATIYRWMKEQLDELAIPYAVLSGNHDDPELLAQVFDLENFLHDGELYYQRRIGEEWIFFLDTTPAMLSQKQLRWLETQLQRSGSSRQIIFMHHPPVLAGIPHMDQHYPLLEPARRALQTLFRASGKEVFIFCGHYHNALSVHCDWGCVHLTPSSYLQIDPHRESFAIEHTLPGYRMIEWSPAGLRTSVHYLASNT